MEQNDGEAYSIEDINAAVEKLLRFRSAASKTVIRVRNTHNGRTLLQFACVCSSKILNSTFFFVGSGGLSCTSSTR